MHWQSRFKSWTVCASSLMICTCILLAIFGCGSAHKTVVNPAESSLTDQTYKESPTRGITHTDEISIVPTSQPSLVETTTTRPSRIVVDGKSVDAPAGSAVTFKSTDTETGTPEKYNHNQHATAHGASLETSATAGADNFKTDLPAVNIKPDADGGGEGSGAATSSFAWKGFDNFVSQTSKASWIFFALAAVSFVGAGVMAWLEKSITDTSVLILLGMGGLFIVTGVMLDKYPIVLLLTFMGAAVSGLLYWNHYRQKKATQAVTTAVESSPPSAQAVVKSNMSAITASQPWLKTLITKAKADAAGITGLIGKTATIATPGVAQTQGNVAAGTKTEIA